ncbi:MAG TPA: ABC transporter permease [Virgibacillus sp.]|nr:ABC transporter permease [Virgibacillus sp.]
MSDNIAEELEELPEDDENVSPSGMRILWRELVSDKLALFSFIYFATITVVVFTLAFIMDLDEIMQVKPQFMHEPPSKEFWLGTDKGGRDVFGQLIIGTRNSLLIGFIITFAASFIGISVGLTAGYFGGTVDNILMRIVDFFLVLPFLMIVIVFVSIVPKYSIISFSAIMTIFLWMGKARLIRSRALQERELEYVHAAKTLGTSNFKIMVTHVLPNLTSIIIVNLTLTLANNIGIESGLSFLGFGFPEDTPSLGTLMSYATDPITLEKRLWVWLPAAILILTLMLSVRNVGEVFKRATDARQRRSG